MPFCAQLMRADIATEPHSELWVFGYGSLIWRPGFTYSVRRKAMLRGWRRSLCVYSHVYRGTPDRPGLVLGLDRGHPQYAGRLTLARQLHFVRQGHGRSGPNRDYVVDTVKALEELGYRDAELHRLAQQLKGAHETHGPPPSD